MYFAAPSRPADGSSNSRMSPFIAMIPATLRRRFCPPERQFVCFDANSSNGRFTLFIAVFTHSKSSFPFIPLFLGPNATSSAAKTSNSAASLFCWHNSGLSALLTVPLSCFFNPARISRSVVFPLPEAPVSAVRVPLFRENDTFFRILCVPYENEMFSAFRRISVDGDF